MHCVSSMYVCCHAVVQGWGEHTKKYNASLEFMHEGLICIYTVFTPMDGGHVFSVSLLHMEHYTPYSIVCT